MQKILLFTILATLAISLLAVPPVPLKTDGYNPVKVYPSQNFGPNSNNRNGELPQNILVLRAEFTDIKFDLEADYPDYVAHDEIYFDRMLFHLSAYLHDASHGSYEFDEDNYTIWETVYTVPNTMAYYGEDDNSTQKIAEFVRDLTIQADPEIDFSIYDAFIVFHAGAGQEADLSGNNTDELWSTFVTQKTLRAGLDPDNEEFPGIETSDGVYLTEFNICPESEWQPDNDENSPKYSMLGVFMHNFGHQLGLPTLFDNNSSNGSSFGIGNFGLMGTGAWNAKGFVPPLPCAWSRMYLGWEDENIQTAENAGDFFIQNFESTNTDLPQIIKIPITDKEYFLVENIQYNADGSTLNGIPNFTFPLLPEGEQDYYDLDPTIYPESVPIFNFMENSYEGCEWNFWLPGLGYGDAPVDGEPFDEVSGLFIWHIDEHIIDATFQSDFELNSPNGNAYHKGVDLEEADGYQHMDNKQSQESLGSAYDAFRAGNNSYFGKLMNPDGDISTPTAESYYGGFPLAVSNISSSDNLMTFSVDFGWNLDSQETGESIFPSALIDFDGDSVNELFQVEASGNLKLWKNDISDPNFISPGIPLAELYAYDEFSNLMLIPTKGEASGLFLLNDDIANFENIDLSAYEWASHPVINPNEASDYRAFLPLIVNETDELVIQIYNGDYELVDSVELGGAELSTNLILANEAISCVVKEAGYNLASFDLNSLTVSKNPLPISVEEVVESALIAPLTYVTESTTKDYRGNSLVVKTENKLYLISMSGHLQSGFPVELDLANSGLPAIADMDGNGILDIVVSGSNSFQIIDNNGNKYTHSEAIAIHDSTFVSNGMIPVDLNDDGLMEIVGNFSNNRLCAWESMNMNDFGMVEGFPVTRSQASRTYPLIGSYPNEDGEATNYIFSTCDDGKIYRKELGSQNIPNWNSEFGNLKRTASYAITEENNQYSTDDIFIEDECYIYPNPYGTTYPGSISTGVYKEETITIKIMTSRVADVELKVFDIAGNIIFKEKRRCDAYDLSANSRFYLNAKKISSGVYFAVIKAKGEVLKLKFALEK